MLVWFFNFMLYLAFVFEPASYRAQVAAGVPCWIQADPTYLPTMGMGDTSGIQPACWYDPRNDNSGFLGSYQSPRRSEPAVAPRLGNGPRRR